MKRLTLAAVTALTAALLVLAAPAHADAPAPLTNAGVSSLKCKPTTPPVQLRFVARPATIGDIGIDNPCGNGWGP
ncbi:hypothetical protein [Streptomyces sp. PvR034]|uniref:hypothetical protein n=1 Tax=Streptomyces sp. PvR034 TaxID=3156401 RepID=UPI0033995955